MHRTIVAAACALVLTAAVAGMALAEEGNFRKGKYLFRKNCRSCHVSGGQASDLSPADKVQADWAKAFDAWRKLPCADQWQGMSDQDRLDIFTYMHDFAKDSPTPAKCS